jgi:HAD superfamily hydrolase (TIGR01509 family)
MCPPDPATANGGGHRRGILFDVDGTLVDTTYIHVVCWWQALRQLDHDVPMACIHRAIGMGSDRILDDLLGPDRDRDRDDALHAARTTLYSTYWDRLRPLPGARELLRAAHDAGLAVVLASSASKPELEKLRRTLDADDILAAATSSADAASSKPAPDILQAALAQSNLSAADVVFVGDSVWDVEAAGALDIACIGLTCGGLAATELADAGAAEVYGSPAELLDRFHDSRAVARVLDRAPAT